MERGNFSFCLDWLDEDSENENENIIDIPDDDFYHDAQLDELLSGCKKSKVPRFTDISNDDEINYTALYYIALFCYLVLFTLLLVFNTYTLVKALIFFPDFSTDTIIYACKEDSQALLLFYE